MNNFIHAINGFHSNDVYYSDTASLYIEIKHRDNLDQAGFVGKGFYKGKTITKTEVFLWIVLSTENKILLNYK